METTQEKYARETKEMVGAVGLLLAALAVTICWFLYTRL